jgi:putative transcriptional regulator
MIDTQGKFLIAPPNMPDWRFQKTVIYMWRHDVSGAAGVVVNKKCKHPDFKHICEEGIIKRIENVNTPVYYGGPVLNNIIGVLHSKEFIMGSTNTGKTQPLAFTLDRKMLECIAQGGGPKQKIITMGVANWTGGQLEDELEALPPRKPAMSWLVLPYDEKIVFGPQPEDLWEMCVSRAVENKTKEILSHNFKD